MVGLLLGVHVCDSSGYGEDVLLQVGRFDNLSSVGSTESIPVGSESRNVESVSSALAKESKEDGLLTRGRG